MNMDCVLLASNRERLFFVYLIQSFVLGVCFHIEVWIFLLGTPEMLRIRSSFGGTGGAATIIPHILARCRMIDFLQNVHV